MLPLRHVVRVGEWTEVRLRFAGAAVAAEVVARYSNTRLDLG
jgi:hypothetical protein